MTLSLTSSGEILYRYVSPPKTSSSFKLDGESSLYAFSPTNKKLNFFIPQAKVLHATAFTRYQFINSFRRRYFLASLSKDAAPTFFQEMKPVICKSSLTTVLIVRMICLLFLLLAARSTEYMVDVSVKLKTTVKMILRICYKYL